MSAALDTAATALFWLAALSLVHVYLGYEWLLRAAVRLAGRRPPPLSSTPVYSAPVTPPTVSILLTVHNEETQVTARLENLAAQEYPVGRLEIVVASDGSTDDTEARVRAFAAARPDCAVTLAALHPQGGKSQAQNLALPEATGEIVVLTDAAARFQPDFVARIVAPFADPEVGCVTGRVAFGEDGGDVARGQGRYWRSEMMLRACESRLGILAVASGQAMAFRRTLFRPLPPHVGDDCIIPLDVVAAGARVVHQPDAVAFDCNETRPARELRARARMTARNWVGTWRHPRLLSPLRHPGIALALWSHKLMRWLSPVFLMVLVGTALWLAGRHPVYQLSLAMTAVVGGLAGLGWAAQRRPGRCGLVRRVAGIAFAFCLAQLGFLLGLWTALRGRQIRAYRNSG
jgi:cellulose synthase/poly-beta-1,6-N-acetylglucosamine synthase-like glycosyltransferase